MFRFTLDRKKIKKLKSSQKYPVTLGLKVTKIIFRRDCISSRASRAFSKPDLWSICDVGFRIEFRYQRCQGAARETFTFLAIKPARFYTKMIRLEKVVHLLQEQL